MPTNPFPKLTVGELVRECGSAVVVFAAWAVFMLVMLLWFAK